MDEIPEVCIPEDFAGPFIQLIGGDGKKYIYAVKERASHVGVYRAFMAEFDAPPLNPLLVGGGYLHVCRDKQVIEAGADSDKFGKFDVDAVRELLERYVDENEEYNGFSVKVE